MSLCLAAAALLRRRKPLPLGPLPPAHALLMAAVSATIFAGTLLSAVAEIRDTRWSWRGRSRTTPLRWLLCFPPGVEMEAGTATQAAADAAVAAAHAAVAVVRLTNKGRSAHAGEHRGPAAAAVRIQTAFRGFLVSIYQNQQDQLPSTANTAISCCAVFLP